MRLNVKEYGARGDGETLDSPAINRAIERIAANGGGELFFPAGVYRVGTIFLKSRLTLHLEAGARLLASPEIADYHCDETVNPHSLRHYLLYGDNCEELRLTGSGCIDGNGAFFWEETFLFPVAENPMILDYNVYKPRRERPVLLYLTRCRNVAIENLSWRNAPAYTVWLIRCERVLIRNLVVRNPRTAPNSDVFDIDCCRKIRVVDCDLEAGDDCIAIKSDFRRLGEADGCCREISVTNSKLASATCAIRVGYEGDGAISDCVFSNLTITDSRHGIDILSIVPEVVFCRIEHGTPIERLLFNNITMRNVGQAFFLWAGRENGDAPHEGFIRNITFSDIDGVCAGSSWIGAKYAGAIQELCFNRIRLEFDPTRPFRREEIDAMPSHWGGTDSARGINFRNINGLQLHECRFLLDNGLPAFIGWKRVDRFHLDDHELPENGDNLQNKIQPFYKLRR